MFANEPEGTRIPGSRFFRSYCPECGEPMRVTEDHVGIMCEKCNPPHRAVGTSRAGPNEYNGEGGGSFDNIVNAYESMGD